MTREVASSSWASTHNYCSPHGLLSTLLPVSLLLLPFNSLLLSFSLSLSSSEAFSFTLVPVLSCFPSVRASRSLPRAAIITSIPGLTWRDTLGLYAPGQPRGVMLKLRRPGASDQQRITCTRAATARMHSQGRQLLSFFLPSFLWVKFCFGICFSWIWDGRAQVMWWSSQFVCDAASFSLYCRVFFLLCCCSFLSLSLFWLLIFDTFIDLYITEVLECNQWTCWD